MNTSLLEGLNQEQQQVVTDLTSHILLSAPAGTGKTTVLARRVAAIIDAKRAEPQEILCLTFTNRACKELKKRIMATVEDENSRDVMVKTIHSFCYSLIKEECKNGTDISPQCIVYDADDGMALIEAILRKQSYYRKLTDRELRKFQSFIETLKKYPILHHMTRTNGDYRPCFDALLADDTFLPTVCAYYDHRDLDMEQWLATNGLALFDAYQQHLRDNNALDFADLIMTAYTLLSDDAICSRWRNRFRYISIDEMQDTSEIEYMVLSRLFPGRTLLLCGDYFQTIYEWRGSHPDLILRKFTTDYKPRHLQFTVNYRSTQTLLHASSMCLQRLFGAAVHLVYPSPHVAASPVKGDPIVVTQTDTVTAEGRWIFHQISQLPREEQLKSCIMVRTNQLTNRIWAGVSAHNNNVPPERQLPFARLNQFQLFKRQECKDVIAFLRVCLNKHDSLSLSRIVKRFAHRIGKRTIETIESESYRAAGISLCDFVDAATARYGEPFGLLLEELNCEHVIVFDVESTGTDTTRDEIIQIAAIKLDRQGFERERFMTYLRPTKPVGDSYHVHHISDEFLAKKGLPPQEGLRQFLDFAGDALIVGHNVSYDLHILASELRRLGMDCPDEPPYYDTLDIFRRFYPTLRNHKLSFLSDHFAIDHKPTHDAFDDILATACLLRYSLAHDIIPNQSSRRAYMAMYLPLFAPIGSVLQSLRERTYTSRPHTMIGYIMNDGGVKAYYELPEDPKLLDNGRINRLDNVRKLYRIAQQLDDPCQHPRDAISSFLQLTALSNSELDSMLDKKPQIPIITIHQAKGLEFDYVFLACLQNGTFPLSTAQDSLQQENEEKRLFYVAMTRAKKKLFLSSHRGYGRHSYDESPFISAIPAEDIERMD